jgi:hypothetical protein
MAQSPSLVSWLFGVAVAAVNIGLALQFLVRDPYLLSGVGIAWPAGVTAVHAQRGVLPVFDLSALWDGAFAGVLT